MTSPTVRLNLRDLGANENLTFPSHPQRSRKPSKPVKPRLALLQAAKDVLVAYRASPDCRELLAALPDMTAEQAVARFGSVLLGQHFEPLMQRLRAPAELETDPIEFIPKAVSFGIMGQVVLGVGASGSVGAVANIDPKNEQLGVYAGGALDIGFDVSLQGDFCIGLWLDAVDDIAGWYVGAEVDIDDGFGFDVAAFEKDEEPALAFVGLDFGVGDGIENEDYYFFEFNITESDPTIYQPGNATYLVQFNNLNCLNSKDNYDTVYFTFQQDGDTTKTYRYPAWDGYQMCESGRNPTYSTWGVGLIAKFNSQLSITLQVGDHTMKAQTICSNSFKGLGTYTTVTFDQTLPDFDEIKYTVGIQLIKS